MPLYALVAEEELNNGKRDWPVRGTSGNKEELCASTMLGPLLPGYYRKAWQLTGKDCPRVRELLAQPGTRMKSSVYLLTRVAAVEGLVAGGVAKKAKKKAKKAKKTTKKRGAKKPPKKAAKKKAKKATKKRGTKKAVKKKAKRKGR